jgi:SAM-dependent MidA family methyltransferase
VELLKKIHAKAKQNEYLTFDDYMEMCLYYPNLGYYNNANISLNPKNADFITGPEISSLYAESILNFYKNCKVFKNVDSVLEFGAGSGEMAYNFLRNTSEQDMPKKYYILEKSTHLIKQQKKKISSLPKKYSDKVVWISNLDKIENVFIIANEVLDAIPSKVFSKRKNKFYEKVIKSKDNALYLSDIDCNSLLKEEIKVIEKRIKRKIPNNYNFEINTNYDNFLSKIFTNIKNFIFLVIDYGYSENEFYHTERNFGTLQYYKNHKKLMDPLVGQGTFDISVSVDFSRVKRISSSHNIELLAYTTQEHFLLNNNILENSEKISNSFEKSNILKSLLFPSDMGENFKIMILCDSMNNDFEINFKDYRHKL